MSLAEGPPCEVLGDTLTGLGGGKNEMENN